MYRTFVLGFLFIFFGCYSKKNIELVNYEKIVSHRNKGLAYLEEENFTEAEKEFKELTFLAPQDPLGYANLGLTYLKSDGQINKSEQWLKKALELNQKDPEIRILLILYYELNSQDSLAFNILKESINYSPNHIKTLYKLTEYYLKRNDINSKQIAQIYLKKIVELIPANISAQLKLIEILLNENKISEATRGLNKISQIFPKLPENSVEMLENSIRFLNMEDLDQAKTYVMIFENLIRPTSFYKSSLIELKGNVGPVSGSPILRFTKIEPVKKYKKAKDYALSKNKIGLFSSSISFLFIMSLLLFNGYGFIDQLITSDILKSLLPFNIHSGFAQSGLFFLILFILNSIISIPFSYYNTFVIEEKFGFNRTTKSTFFLDILKSFLLSILIGGALLFLALYLYDNLNDGFWLWLWIGLSFLIIFINMFYADLIVPIFNKLKPLDDGELRQKIEKYSKEVGYLLKNIYVIDGSKRSTKANAFFSGLGPRKTIALYDTLIEKHTEDELVAVLAHEVGHFKKKHIFSGLIMSIIQIGVMTFFFELCLKLPEISLALGGSEASFHLGLIGFSIIFSPISMLSGILMNYISRKNEFEADAYAKETFNGEDLSLALKKLSVDSLSNIYPHPLYVFFHYSHPPLIQRLRALN